jgi:maleate isomerase
MVSRLSALLGVPVVPTRASAVEALRLVGVERVALVGAPWFDAELNALAATYFRSQGFDVVSSRSAERKPPGRLEPHAVCAWVTRTSKTGRKESSSEGTASGRLPQFAPLEAAIGRPVLTSNQVLLWRLLAQAGAPLRINGYGQLFARGF